MNSTKHKRSFDVPAAFLFCSIIYLLFFHPTWLTKVNPTTDDGCYLARMAGFLLLDSGPYCHGVPNYFASGGPIAWIPAGFAGAFLARLTGGLALEGAVAVVAHMSFALLGVCFLLVVQILRLQKVSTPLLQKHPHLFSVLFLLSTFVLYYATGRPLMVHSLELTLCLATLYALLIDKTWWALFGSLFVCATRYNDIPIMLMLVGYVIDRRAFFYKRSMVHAKISLILGATVAVLAGVYIAFFRGYGGSKLVDLFPLLSWDAVFHFLFNLQFGVIWVATWWVMSLILGLRYFHLLSNMARGGLIWILLVATICIMWNTPGGDFGYRYLLGSFVAALLIWMECLKLRPALLQSVFVPLLVVNSVVLTWLNFVYKVNSRLGYLLPNEAGILSTPENPIFLVQAYRALFEKSVYWDAIQMHFPALVTYRSFTNDHGHWLAVLPPGSMRWVTLVATLVSVGYLTYRIVRLAAATMRRAQLYRS